MTTEPAERDYGPSLPELLRPWLQALGRWQRLALGLVLALVLAGAAALLIRHEVVSKTYVQTAGDARTRGLPQIPFHFDHSSKLETSKPAASYVQAERLVKGTLFGRFAVSALRLGRQSGLPSAFLPIAAIRYEQRAARQFDGFRLQFEGRARVNDVEGYQFAFTARLPRPGLPPRQLFGRVVMLPEPFDVGDPERPYPEGENPTRGLIVTMLATTLDKVPSATRVGDQGILQRPFRSFRFGT